MIYIYTIEQKGMMGEKSPREHKISPIWFPSHPHLYDMESRLFSGPKDRLKTSRAFPTGVGPMLIGIKEKGKGAARR